MYHVRLAAAAADWLDRDSNLPVLQRGSLTLRSMHFWRTVFPVFGGRDRDRVTFVFSH